MLSIWYILFLFAATIVTLRNWRNGMFFLAIIAVLQDPVRKLTPDTPALFTLSSIPVLFAIWMGGTAETGGLFRHLEKMHPGMAATLKWFLGALVLAFLVVLQHGAGAMKVGIVGAAAYITPILTLACGMALAKDTDRAIAFMKFYCVIHSIALIGVPLQYLKVYPEAKVLGTAILGGEWVKSFNDQTVQLVAGLYRSPDIMGWHAAMVVIFCLAFLVTGKKGNKWFWLFIAAWAASCLILGARRKTIWLPLIWGGVCLATWIFQRRLPALRIVFTLTLFLLIITAMNRFIGITDAYFGYAVSATTEIEQRLGQQTFSGPIVTLKQNGIMGLGLGTASQGRQHVEGVRLRTWQEDGVSKIMVELGVLGLVTTAFLSLAILKALFRSTNNLANSPRSDFAVALLGVSIANIACFLNSHQVFGDLLIVNLAALFVGMLLGSSDWDTAEPAVST